jgi:hypothetical protein
MAKFPLVVVFVLTTRSTALGLTLGGSRNGAGFHPGDFFWSGHENGLTPIKISGVRKTDQN